MVVTGESSSGWYSVQVKGRVKSIPWRLARGGVVVGAENVRVCVMSR